MKGIKTIILLFIIISPCALFGQPSPDQLYGQLFHDVQTKEIYRDSKTFADAIPLKPPSEILEYYSNNHKDPSFDLNSFLKQNFRLPEQTEKVYQADATLSIEQHINHLWNVLKRPPQPSEGSLLELPHPYIVPGGRFRELYYWDTYFTMLGLKASNETELIEDILNNFAFQIDQYGFIPNGNRTYYLSRSQPPFFALMVKLYADIIGTEAYVKYLPYLEKEYDFWMAGATELNSENSSYRRAVRMKEGEILNRYWDDRAVPRPESYKEDIELAKKSDREPEDVYLNIRAACESGWDFSSRWFKDNKNFSTIHTTEIIPIDLNCLLFFLETTIAEGYKASENPKKELKFRTASVRRKNALNKYCLNNETYIYHDYDIMEESIKPEVTLASVFPLYFKLASPESGKQTANMMKYYFLQDGGLVTTLKTSNEQWDAPNGWAPLHWMTICGLRNYGYLDLSEEIKKKWVNTNLKEFSKSRKLLEKYNVKEQKEGGGGEYPLQDGFGWTNGVLLHLLMED